MVFRENLHQFTRKESGNKFKNRGFKGIKRITGIKTDFEILNEIG